MELPEDIHERAAKEQVMEELQEDADEDEDEIMSDVSTDTLGDESEEEDAVIEDSPEDSLDRDASMDNDAAEARRHKRSSKKAASARKGKTFAAQVEAVTAERKALAAQVGDDLLEPEDISLASQWNIGNFLPAFAAQCMELVLSSFLLKPLTRRIKRLKAARHEAQVGLDSSLCFSPFAVYTDAHHAG